MRISATARGSLAAPQLAGTVSLAGGSIFDPATNIRLQNIALDAALDGNAAQLRSFRAEAAGGGAITAQGRVGFGPGFPADLTAQLRDVRYTDGVFVATRLSGDLTLEGPLVGGGGMLAGRIDIGRTEISVAEGLGANAQGALDQVSHVNTPPGGAGDARPRRRRHPARGAGERPGGDRAQRADQRAEPESSCAGAGSTWRSAGR